MKDKPENPQATMKVLTDNQKEWLRERNIKVGSICSIPNSGFSVYATADLTGMEWMDAITVNQIYGDTFRILDETDDCYKINLAANPSLRDFYILKPYLKVRSLEGIAMMYLFCAVPFMIYNLCGAMLAERSKSDE